MADVGSQHKYQIHINSNSFFEKEVPPSKFLLIFWSGNYYIYISHCMVLSLVVLCRYSFFSLQVKVCSNPALNKSISSVQFSSVAQSCPTLCNPMNHSTPGLPVHHYFPEFTQPHVHRVRDAIQPSHPGLSPSPPAPNLSQYQSLFQWVNFSHEVAKVLEFQL